MKKRMKASPGAQMRIAHPFLRFAVSLELLRAALEGDSWVNVAPSSVDATIFQTPSMRHTARSHCPRRRINLTTLTMKSWNFRTIVCFSLNVGVRHTSRTSWITNEYMFRSRLRDGMLLRNRFLRLGMRWIGLSAKLCNWDHSNKWIS